MTRWIVLGIAVLLLVVGIGLNLAQAGSSAQPWGQSLFDNFLLARMIPFVLGLGVAVGLARAIGWQPRANERFASSTVLLHWLATLAVLVGLATGAWQYLKGLLDVPSPVSMPLVYRLHYLAAMLLLFTMAVLVTDWLLRREGALKVQSGQWIRNLRGLAHELPRPLGALLGYLVGLDMRRAPPPIEQFTPYEKIISFPTWVIALGLIVITGLLKAMRYIYPIPGDVLYWASAIHVGAMVLLGIKVLDHLRYVLAPSRWTLFKPMYGSPSDQRSPTPQPVGTHARQETTV
jgi:thiosulfate reductase cytochrome b subunit